MSEKNYTDTELLNALQDLTVGYGNGWVLRGPNTGRGMRLHETSGLEGKPNVRDAIKNYLNQIEKSLKE